MGDMAQIGQNGAQMLNSAINSMSARREMEGRIQMEKDSLAARERMNSANISASDLISKRKAEDDMTMQSMRIGSSELMNSARISASNAASEAAIASSERMSGATIASSERMNSARISANDSTTRAMATYDGLKNLYSSHLQEISSLEAEARPIMKMIQNNEPLSDELTAKLTTLNNMTTASKSAFAALTKAGGEGSVEEEKIDPATGAKTKISYPNIQSYELHKGVSGGGQQKSAQELTDSYYPQTMKQTANPVAPVDETPPADFVPNPDETTKYNSETTDMRKSAAELQLKRDSLARSGKKQKGGVIDRATSVMDYELTDKERAASVRRLDAELAKKKKQIDSRQGN